ncbi:MAG: hypothetical protein HY606_03315 [Planctomycetes bacterium]|nr:hypothetical protein [Planctomycetota bacterium]
MSACFLFSSIETKTIFVPHNKDDSMRKIEEMLGKRGFKVQKIEDTLKTNWILSADSRETFEYQVIIHVSKKTENVSKIDIICQKREYESKSSIEDCPDKREEIIEVIRFTCR